MAIMLAVNSAADKSSCPFGSLKLLDIISLSRLACVSDDEIWGAKPLRARMKPCARMPSAPEFRARVFFISSSRARVRLSHAAFAVSKRRFPDHRSMDWCELRLFLFPERDVVVPTRRDAHQRTSEPSLSHCGPGVIFRTDRTARQQLATLGHSQGCAKLPKCRCARIYTKCCILNTREAERLSSAGWSRRGGREPSCLIDGEVVCCDGMGVAAPTTPPQAERAAGVPLRLRFVGVEW